MLSDFAQNPSDAVRHLNSSLGELIRPSWLDSRCKVPRGKVEKKTEQTSLRDESNEKGGVL